MEPLPYSSPHAGVGTPKFPILPKKSQICRPGGRGIPLPVDVALRKADLLVHSVPQVWLQGVEILADRREEAAVDCIDHL